MKKASISQAKNSLSALIDRVKHGQTITIEDRGIAVARLAPVTDNPCGAEARTTRLERQGVLRRPATAPDPAVLRSRPPAPRRGRRASDEVIAERREGR